VQVLFDPPGYLAIAHSDEEYAEVRIRSVATRNVLTVKKGRGTDLAIAGIALPHLQADS
jgi:hypothetical protein